MTGFDSIRPVAMVAECTPETIPAHVYESDEPVLLKGLVKNWPAVERCSESLVSAASYLSNFWSDRPVTAYVGDSEIDGRFFYNEAFSGFNFASGKTSLPEVFQKLGDENRPTRQASIYVGSTPVDDWLPGFRKENDLCLPSQDVLANFWLGTATKISAHYDFPDNIACVVAGARRFTLFPPDQVANLYVGPLDRTPSGQAISLVDFSNPDFARFPKFADALEQARLCELEPGDAIFIPSMWWHHVESLEPFNLLVNYWWCTSPAFLGSPTNALMHAILAIRDLPERQRDAWREVFNHYIFGADEGVYEHIPEEARGCLSPLDDAAARQLRAELLTRLNR